MNFAEASPLIKMWLTPDTTRRVQSFYYYAAHFLIGAGLTGGDLEGSIKSLAGEFRKHYEIGVDHGIAHPGDVTIRPRTHKGARR